MPDLKDFKIKPKVAKTAFILYLIMIEIFSRTNVSFYANTYKLNLQFQ